MSSGSNATVFKICIAKKNYALRCFNRLEPEILERSRKISEFLTTQSFPFLVDYEFVDQGIEVDGLVYPVVLMDWVESVSLESYVETNADNAARMDHLITSFNKIVATLQDNHLAHGDLQHRNVVLTKEHQVKLIDYDGFYIPSLRDETPVELGHNHFTHPDRFENGVFDERIDRFPAWIISGGLQVARRAPEIFLNRLDYGRDNCLLFNQDDFSSGETSLKRALADHNSREVRFIATLISKFSCQAWDTIPRYQPDVFISLQIPKDSGVEMSVLSRDLPAILPLGQDTEWVSRPRSALLNSQSNQLAGHFSVLPSRNVNSEWKRKPTGKSERDQIEPDSNNRSPKTLSTTGQKPSVFQIFKPKNSSSKTALVPMSGKQSIRMASPTNENSLPEGWSAKYQWDLKHSSQQTEYPSKKNEKKGSLKKV